MPDVLGTMTITEKSHSSMKKIKAAWVSGQGNYANTVSGTTTNYYDGQIWGAITVPGTSTTTPLDNYDITVKDSDSIDVALGALANRDQTNTEYVTSASMAGVASDTLTITVTTAGSANSGTLYLLIR